MSLRRAAGTALVLGAVASGGLLAGCGDDEDDGTGQTGGATTSSTAAAAPSGPAQASAKVAIKDFDYAPKSVTVKSGGTVTWTNEDAAPHNSENGDGGKPEPFTTKTPLNQGDSDTVTFSTPGTYTYYCVYHRFMKADVIVK